MTTVMVTKGITAGRPEGLQRDALALERDNTTVIHGFVPHFVVVDVQPINVDLQLSVA